jgi:anti-sigma B factor antagonist
MDLATLSCRVEARGTSHIVSVEGEIDLSTVSRLRHAVHEAFEAHPETLVIDLAGVTFMDSTGLHALIDADHRSRAGGIRLVIMPAAEVVHHPFRLAGVDGWLPFARRSTPDGQ